MRAPAAGIRLNNADAAIAKGMINRGDRQHDIAAYFGVNGGRIAEISTGDKFGSVAAAPTNQLPPPGPYVYSKLNRRTKKDLESIRDQLVALSKVVHDALSKL